MAPEDIFSRVRLFLVVLGFSWVEHARSVRRAMSPSASGSDATASWSRSRATTATCCSTSSQRGIPVLGVEPAANVAAVARERGHPRRSCGSSGVSSPRSSSPKDAGRPDRRQQRAGPRARPQRLRARDATAAEAATASSRSKFPHLHAPDGGATSSTRSITSTSRTSRPDRAERSSPRTGSTVFDVEELPTHGGSLRIYARHGSRAPARHRRVRELRRPRARPGLRHALETYTSFADRSRRPSGALLEFLIGPGGRQAVAGYGAPGKGNTLLNYCGIRSRLPRLHGRPQSLQAGAVPARARTSRSATPEALEQDGPTTS